MPQNATWHNESTIPLSDALSPRSATETLARESTVACNLRSVYSRWRDALNQQSCELLVAEANKVDARGNAEVGEKSPCGKRGCLFRVSNEHSVYSVVNHPEQFCNREKNHFII